MKEKYRPRLLSTPASGTEEKECKQPKKRKTMCNCEIVGKITMKKKKRDEKRQLYQQFAYETCKFCGLSKINK